MFGREHLEEIERTGGVAPVAWPTRFQTPGSVMLSCTTTGAQLFAEDGLAQVSVSLSRAALVDIVQTALEILQMPRQHPEHSEGHTERSLARIEAALAIIMRKVTQMAASLDEITATVKRTEDAEDAAIALLQGLKAALDAAGTDPVALKALSDELGAKTDALAAAVVANTPTP